jgi:ribose 5-phosphate isomerase B
MIRVLLVCTGNTCRSAIAEGLLRHLLAARAKSGAAAPVTVSSAGTAAFEGLPASADAVEACRELGADITRHRSRQLTPRLLADSDLVLVMEEHHRQAVLELHPGSAGRTFLLSEYAGEGDEPIPDPIGGGPAFYRRTGSEMQRRLEAALPRLLAQAGAGEPEVARARAAGDRPDLPGIEIGADHRGYALKQTLIRWLGERGHAVTDRGCDSPVSCDYPIVAFAVARAVAGGPDRLGVLICGSGVGMSIAANKVAGIRAALCHTPEMARLSRCHNDANVLVLGADLVSPEENRRILEAWLEAAFEGGRHARRVRQMMEGERHGGPGRGEGAHAE